MARYGNTILTSAGLDLAKRTVNGTSTFKITRVVTSGDSTLQNATIEQVLGLTSLNSIVQTGTVTAFDTSDPKQIGLKAQFVNRGLTNQYKIYAVGIYAQEVGKSEILYAVAPAVDPETMPARPSDSEASFTFTLQIYAAVANSSSVTISATTEGVVKSVNGTFKPDANGDLSLPFQSQAEANQLRDDLTRLLDSETQNRQNDDNSVLSQAKAYTDTAKSDLTTAMTNEVTARTDADNSVLSQAKAYTDDAKSGLTSRIVNAEGNISQLQRTASGLTSRVGSAEDNISQLQQTASGLTSTLSNGGTNLISGTRDFSFTNNKFSTDNYKTVNQTDQYNDTEHVTERKIVMTPGVNQGFWWLSDNTVGKTYTLSFDARSDNGKASIWVAGLENNFLGTSPALTTNWIRYHFTVNVTKAGNNWVIYFQTSEADNVYVRKLQIEYGATPTPWNLSSGDISSIAQTANDISKGLASEATARTNADNSVLSQAKAYTDTAKSDLTTAMTNADSSMLSKANAYTDFALRGVWTPTVITTAIDLNNIKACGNYFIQNDLGTTSNAPIQNSWLYVRVEGVPTRITQTAWKDIDPANQWVRVFIDNSWGNWVHITKAI